mmetsp:Transcript_10247/g.15303  ORF Transcript_10247/g.15303 Transcript_10247/m.15303 type:complete len:348 (+) Transcript_10247:71-1114(+)
MEYKVLSDDSVSSCLICTKEKPKQEFLIIPNCEHYFCTECLKSYFIQRIESNTVLQIGCPMDECYNSEISEVAQLVLDQETKARLDELKFNAEVDSDPNKHWCPVPNCRGFAVVSSEGVFCQTCSTQVCPECTQEAHTGECLIDQSLSEYIRSHNLKKCPNCTNFIEKRYGCNEVKCPCGTKFCIRCGKLYDDDHDFLKCEFGENLDQAPWRVVVFLCLTWVILPFAFGIVFISELENWRVGEISEDLANHILKYKKIYYPLIVVLSLPGCALIIVYFAARQAYRVSEKILANKSVSLKILTFPGVVILFVINFLLCNLLGIFMFSITVFFMPFLGIMLLLIKLDVN